MTRLRLKGHCIFGQFVGYKDSAKQYVLFLDEETNEVKTYHKSKLELSYEKLGWNYETYIRLFNKLN